jgi:hypothetical protein
VREDRDSLLSKVSRITQRSREKSEKIDQLHARVKMLEEKTGADDPDGGKLRRKLEETTLALQERSVEVDLLSIRIQRMRSGSPVSSPQVSGMLMGGGGGGHSTSSASMGIGGGGLSPASSPMLGAYDRPASAPPSSLLGLDPGSSQQQAGRRARRDHEKRVEKEERRRKKDKDKRPGCTG